MTFDGDDPEDEPNAPTPHASSPRPVPPGVLIGERVGDQGPRLIVVPRPSILFIFSALAIARNWIDARWAQAPRFHGRKLYARTVETIVRIDCSSLSSALSHFEDLPLRRVYHGVAANLHWIREVDFDGKLKRIGFVVGRDSRGSRVIEWLTVSRRAAREIESQLRSATRRS
jgi:hypothetical protein